ncbi:MAG: orotate phosphoribosyltransferase [candidate division NC10 bacterium]|nr:orotate phosphoribosyltransferase [candidate division NC10 bacterium]
MDGTLLAEEILKIFKDCGALLEGHFLLSSGLHSSQYLQCALILQYPPQAERLCALLAVPFQEEKIQVVVAPALGGIIVAHEVARALGARSLFTERVEGQMTLRRGFQMQPGERTLVVEDVITTGGSTKEVMAAVEAQGGVVVGVGSLVDRSGGVRLGAKQHALLHLDIPNYPPESCPLCQKGMPLTKPGSRQARPEKAG